MNAQNLIVERQDAVATVTINRPAVLNALNAATLDELRRTVLDLRHDAGVRVVVVTGAGPKAFVAGADISELTNLGPAEARETALRGQHVFELIENLGKPVIAAINGFALGAGCELAMACTFRLAADTARLGQPEVNLGLIPGFGGTQRLARLVGRDRAMDLILTGRHVAAEEALQMGLVTRVVPAARLWEETLALAASISAKSPLIVRFALDAINHGLDMRPADGARYEAALFAATTATDDMREGTRAFLEKRKPEFTGR